MPPLSAEQVAAWRANGEAQWGRLRLDLIRAFLDRHLALAPVRVLDAGCGLAELSLAYARAGSEVVAMDPSGAMLAAAAERAGGLPGIRFLHVLGRRG